jgi:sugar lactone lactonase YvrE
MRLPGSEDLDVEVAVDVRAEVGEGPHWDHARGILWFVDLTGGTVFRYHPGDGTVTRFPVGQEVGAAIPRRDGGLVLAVRDGIATATDDGDEFRIAVPVERDRPGNRMNDAKCDPAGRLLAGTTAFDFAPGAGALYRIDPDWSSVPVLRDVTTSNGTAWSPDGGRMYFIDSATQGIDAFDYDVATGAIGPRTRLVTIAREDGVPDGMTVDADGRLWVACFGAGAVRCYSPSGALTLVVDFPVAQVTSCAFGGPDLTDLYVTSARYRLTAEQEAREPLAGATFLCRPGATGSPAAPFAG